MTGQDAVNVAKSFNDMLDITGVILTKLDGDTRGGAALSVLSVTGKPIKFAASVRRQTTLSSSTPTVWLTEYSVWAMCFHSSKRPR